MLDSSGGFGEKYDSAAKELIDHAISSFSNIFQSLRDRVITLHSLKLNRVSKATKNKTKQNKKTCTSW